MPKRIRRFLICVALGCWFALLPINVRAYPLQQAQLLNDQGRQHLEQGNPNAALKTWQQAETLYRRSQDPIGIIGTQLNQAKALQALGFYRRAQTTLEQVEQSLSKQPDSSLKVNALISLGNLLRVEGAIARSQAILQTGLAIAQRLNSPPDLQLAYLHLGDLYLDQNQFEPAQRAFNQAIQIPEKLRFTAQLQRLKLLIKSKQSTDESIAALQANLETATVYEQIEFAKLLLHSQPRSQAAAILAHALQSAQTDKRAQSLALGELGQLYEQSQQWSDAKQVTQQALIKAKAIQVPELIYQWQWQLGRILAAQNNLPAATHAYTEAVETLRSLRQDLIAINQDIQFSFREQVEPVYRELVELLMRGDVSQAHLKQARETLESLQLAELNNFFRQACLDTTTLPADQIDATAAVIYPIILRDRLEVILSIPNQPLQHYTTNLPEAQIEAAIQRLTQSMRRTSFAKERLEAAQPLYQWLIQPAIPSLNQSSIQTLVFVMDGALRRLPIAALHDGNHYLIEQYRLALTPNLRLFQSHGLPTRTPKALVGGLSEGKDPLPGVKQEVDQIRTQLNAEVLMDQAFTVRSLYTTAATQPFEILHLATHGQFGSTAQDTYIQTWDGRLTLADLQTLLTQRTIELLVLSACETAKGDDRAALGMAGVAVRSGARSTLATLWKVNDTSTATLVSEFYRYLSQEHLTRSEALRKAQLSLLHHPQYNHPFYWAPFVLVGNWQ